MKVDAIEIHTGEPEFGYTPVRELEVKCEARTNFSSTPTMNDVNAKLRELAVQVGADAVARVAYKSGASPTSWRSMRASGLAVKKVSDEVPCPNCAETIKRAAKQCRFCGAAIAAELPPAQPRRGGPPSRVAAAIPSEPLRSSDNAGVWIIVAVAVLFLVLTLANL